MGAAGVKESAQKENSAVEIVRPENYSIRRFQEIVQDAKPKDEKSPQEELISIRAKLVIAEQRLQDLKNRQRQQQLTPPLLESSLVKEVHLRSAQSQVDHYAKLVERSEEKILKDKRQKRSQSDRKNKTKR